MIELERAPEHKFSEAVVVDGKVYDLKSVKDHSPDNREILYHNKTEGYKSVIGPYHSLAEIRTAVIEHIKSTQTDKG